MGCFNGDYIYIMGCLNGDFRGIYWKKLSTGWWCQTTPLKNMSESLLG